VYFKLFVNIVSVSTQSLFLHEADIHNIVKLMIYKTHKISLGNMNKIKNIIQLTEWITNLFHMKQFKYIYLNVYI